MASSRFELVQDGEGKFHFHLRSPDGNALLRSLGCDSKIMAQNEVIHARTSLRDAARMVPHHGDDGEHFVVLKDRDGSVLARSPQVHTVDELSSLADLIRTCGSTAPIVDLTRRRAEGA